ncbi:hypothetical protein JCM1840_005009 [Sporobolomyces johnsonii]
MSSAPAPSSIRLLLLGATGETGRHALAAALSSPAVSQVNTFGRSPPKTVDQGTPGFSKLVHTPLDFEKLLASDDHAAEAKKLKDANADVVLCTLGTTRKNAGSAEAFERIDRDYVLKAAEAARIEGKKQKMIYLSSGGASSSSPFLYPKSKGLTEEGLAALGYDQTIIFRPGFLVVPGGRKGDHRLAESLFGKLTGVLSHFTDSTQIETPLLGRALVNAAVATGELAAPFANPEKIGAEPHSVVAINNAGAMKLGNANEDELRKA